MITDRKHDRVSDSRGEDSRILCRWWPSILLLLGIVWIPIAPVDAQGDNWEETQRLLPSTGQPEDKFGRVVAVDGNRMVIGSHYDDDLGNFSGSATVYERDINSGTWQEGQLLLASNASSMDFFGHSVAIAGNHIFVGAIGADGSSSSNGAVYVFERDTQGTWQEIQILVANVVNSSNSFGETVVVDGDLLAIGDPTGSTIFSGSVFLYQRDAQTGQWSQIQHLIPPDTRGNQQSFGRSIAIHDDSILIGRPEHSAGIGFGVGSAYVYQRDPADGSWILEQHLFSSTAQEYEGFGGSVAIDDGVLVISAFAPYVGPTVPPASTRIFERNPDTDLWHETQQLDCPNGCGGPTYQAIAVEQDILAIGSTDTDSVTIYRKDPESCQWLEAQQLTSSAGNSAVGFGTSIGISGRTIVVGAPDDDEQGSNAGAATIFRAAGIMRDCNGNGIEDSTDIASGFSNDCNGNGRPDECDVPCYARDCNFNGIPDECEEDCNGNRIPDDCDIESGFSQDLDGNLVPDECEICLELGVVSELCTDEGNVLVSFEITNISGLDAHKLILPGQVDFPGGTAIISPTVIIFTPALPGDGSSSATVEFLIEGAAAGTQIEIPFALMYKDDDGNLQECCSSILVINIPDGCDGIRFVRGDTNQDADINIADAIGVLNYLFNNAGTLCVDANDVNDSGTVSITDAVNVLCLLFCPGSPPLPPAPYPGCGIDPTIDNLDCQTFPGCN